MKLKGLKSGSFRGAQLAVGDNGAFVDREVLMVYDGGFESMDGHVDITPAHIKLLHDNHNAKLAALGIKEGDWRPNKFPPLQLDHSTSATVTVGRLMGPVRIEMADVDGIMRTCLVGRVRVLGAANVEPASDGRWENVSIGADLDAGIIKELSITPFPAAANATLLSEGADTMDPKKLKSYLKRTGKLSDKDVDDKLAKMSDDEKKELWGSLEAEEKRFTEHFAGAGLSEQETKDKLGRLSDDEKDKLWGSLEAKRMADEETKKEKEELSALKKKLADADTDKKKMAALRAAKDNVVKLFASAEALGATTKLTALVNAIHVKLAAFQRDGKVTPAERKKIDVKALAAKGATIVDERMQAYAEREPVIHMGQVGTVTPVDVAVLKTELKALERESLEAETRARFTSAKGSKEAQLKAAEMAKKSPTISTVRMAKAAEGVSDPTHLKHLEAYCDMISKCAGEGDIKGLMGHLDGLRKSLSSMAFPPMAEDAEKQMSAITDQVTKLTGELTHLKTTVLELMA